MMIVGIKGLVVSSPPRKFRDNWTVVNGQRIFAKISDHSLTGAGPIVLIHGLGVTGRYLMPTAERLADRYVVAVPDLPGWGKSANPDHTLSIPELADVVAAWMTGIGLSRATLLGNSFGCQIIVEFALRHPDRLDNAILVGPSGDPTRRSPVVLLSRLGVDAFQERPSNVVRTLREYRRFGLRRGIETFRMMINDPIEAKLPRVAVPTLVVRGGRDPIISQRWVERMVTLLPHGELAVVERAAHAVNDDDPDDLATLVDTFLSKQVVRQ